MLKFKKKNQNRFKLIGFLRQKVPVWLGFFPVWVRSGFFGLRLIKSKPNRTSWFF
jgi:hypothetical protein